MHRWTFCRNAVKAVEPESCKWVFKALSYAEMMGWEAVTGPVGGAQTDYEWKSWKVPHLWSLTYEVIPLFSWELHKTPVNFSAAVSASWGDFVTRLGVPAHCAELVVVQGLLGLSPALCPPEGITAVAEKDIQVISVPRGSSQMRFPCIFSAPLTHCRLQKKRSEGLTPLPVGLCLCGAAVEWEVSRHSEQQRGFPDGAGWGRKWDADFLQGFPEGASLRMLCDTVHWQSGWLLHCQ